MARDDFQADVKDTLAHRVGMRCSNPNCRQATSGPRDDPNSAVNVGVAAHVTAASKGGPRYAGSLTAEQRRSIENGIWLCQNCAKLVDNDGEHYTVDLLRQWKRLSEEAARLAIDSPQGEPRQATMDEELIRFYAQCFDRPAFQDPFRQEGSMEAFDRAIEDTITAINTGCLRSRDGAVLAQAKGKAYLRNAEWRRKMDVIVDLLRAIRSRYDTARREEQIHVHEHVDEDSFYCFLDPELADWMDSTRAQILGLFSEVAREVGVHPHDFPRRRVRNWHMHNPSPPRRSVFVPDTILRTLTQREPADALAAVLIKGGIQAVVVALRSDAGDVYQVGVSEDDCEAANAIIREAGID